MLLPLELARPKRARRFCKLERSRGADLGFLERDSLLRQEPGGRFYGGRPGVTKRIPLLCVM